MNDILLSAITDTKGTLKRQTT